MDLRIYQDADVPQPGLTIQRATTEALLGHCLRVWERESPDDVVELCCALYAVPALAGRPWMRWYLGTLDGLPIATLAVFFGADVASIGPIEALAPYRWRGIGMAMTRAAMHTACDAGYSVGLLTASPIGRRYLPPDRLPRVLLLERLPLASGWAGT